MAIKRLYGESDDTYNKRSSMKGYTYKDSAAKEALKNQIMNRPKFQYDLGTDMNYQQAKEQYKALGKTAMDDTVGRASSLTGGYGNSFATSAGQQAYNNHLKALNDSIPEYYAMALDAYDREGAEMLDKYNIYDAEDQQGYARYMDEYNNVMNLAQMENSDAISQRSYDYQLGRDKVLDNQWLQEFNFNKERAKTADDQWLKTFNYNKSVDDRNYKYQVGRDKVEDDQWLKEFNANQATQTASNNSIDYSQISKFNNAIVDENKFKKDSEVITRGTRGNTGNGGYKYNGKTYSSYSDYIKEQLNEHYSTFGTINQGTLEYLLDYYGIY